MGRELPVVLLRELPGGLAGMSYTIRKLGLESVSSIARARRLAHNGSSVAPPPQVSPEMAGKSLPPEVHMLQHRRNAEPTPPEFGG